MKYFCAPSAIEEREWDKDPRDFAVVVSLFDGSVYVKKE